MIRNFQLALRNLSRHKGVNLINILGLAIGMLAVLLIWQYIRFESSFDKYLVNADRIERLVFYRFYKTGLDKSVGNNYFVGQIAYEKIPEIENFCRCKRLSQYVQAGEQVFKEDRTLFADSSFFDIFSYEVVSGNINDFLRRPDVAIITESTARKYFGNEEPVGKIIYGVNPGKKPVTVQGVVKDVAPNSHLRFDLVISLLTITNQSYCYSCNNTNTYFLLREGSDKTKVEQEITRLAKEEFVSRNVIVDFDIEYHLQNITDIHLHSDYRFEHEPNGNSIYLSILLGIAVLILASAVLNYFNLYSSITNRRIGSVGVRIINGASGRDIIREFIAEALLTGLISLVLAIVLLDFLFPVIKRFINLDFTLDSIFKITTWLLPAVILIILAVLSGLVLGLRVIRVTPAFFLRKEPAVSSKRLAGKFYTVGQFIIAIVLITCTSGAMKQINYMQKEAFTMDIDQTLVVKRPAGRAFNVSQTSFQESLLMFPGIKEITFSTVTPGENNTWVKGGICLKGKESTDYQFYQSDVAANFFSFFDVKLLAGRHFFPDENNWIGGPRHVILNKEAALALGEDNFNNLIGQSLIDTDNTDENIGEIVGVIDGYFQNSLDKVIIPTIFNCDQAGDFIFIKIRDSNIPDIMDLVRSEFQKHFKDQYFEYYFLDEFFNDQYKSHIQLFRCFVLFSLMAVIITSLSLLGLVLLISVARTKEIGIRKLNGAGISDILVLLNKDFVLLVTIAFLIAFPVSWYILHRWLQSFAYRTNLEWWVFVLPGVIAFGLTLFTVSLQSWRAATRNPVESLRDE